MIVEPHYCQNPNFIYRRIIDQIVLVPIHQNVADMDCLYTLNEVGAFIWEKLKQPATPAELHAALLEDYEIDPQTAARDLETYLSELSAIGALRTI